MYTTTSHSRFAEPDEIISTLQKVAEQDNTAAGISVYYDGESLYVDSSDYHTIAIGPTGCKKTRTLVIPLVNTIISAGESAVINDPKGEIYKLTSGFAAYKGADVKVINFRKPSASYGWNPLSLAYKYHQQDDDETATQYLNDFVTSVTDPLLKTTVDRYWSDSTNSFLIGVCQLLMESVPEQYFNLKNLIQFCFEKNSYTLSEMANQLDPCSSAAMNLRSVLDLSAEKTKSCVYSTILSALSPFTKNNSLLEMLCNNDVSSETLGEKQTLIYIIYPDEKISLNFLVNSFLTQCYEALISLSETDQEGKIPVRVNFVLDEFSNLPAIPNFDNRISEARSHNIRFHLFAQSYGQLFNKYSEHAETILSNCNNWICFSSKEIEFLKKISQICGTEVDFNGKEHDLIDPSQIQHLKKYKDGAEVVVIRAGEYPFVTKLPDFAYLPVFKSYPYFVLDVKRGKNSAKYFTFEEWLDGIKKDRFAFPII